MPAAVEVVPIAAADRSALDDLMHDYLREMAAIISQPPLHHYPRLDRYWSEPERWPLWILGRGRRVGFALLRHDPTEGVFDMAEFFVVRQSRRAGIGMSAARTIIARHPGRWRITQFEANTNAISFWHRVLAIYSYEERTTNVGVLRREQLFAVLPG